MSTINTEGFKYVSEIEFNGNSYKSCYNHNYYTNGSELILEECDDADCFSYYRILNNSTEYLGCIYSLTGIFDDDNSETLYELYES